VQVIGYGLLCMLYPEDVFDLAGRIDGALTAYACGDALGVPWESPSNAIAGAAASQIEQLPAREGWPRGATSDDTALTLLVALEGAGPSMVLEAPIEEAREAAQAVTTEPLLAEMLTQLSARTWEPSLNGISLDPYETVVAVLRCATRATSLRGGLVSAV
jgi:ADP-ribosylglycohydrolase